jgi:hypothetical protein
MMAGDNTESMPRFGDHGDLIMEIAVLGDILELTMVLRLLWMRVNEKAAYEERKDYADTSNFNIGIVEYYNKSNQ